MRVAIIWVALLASCAASSEELPAAEAAKIEIALPARERHDEQRGDSTRHHLVRIIVRAGDKTAGFRVL